MDRHSQDPLKTVADKAVELQSEIASERGPFTLFALDSINLLQIAVSEVIAAAECLRVKVQCVRPVGE